MNIKDYIHGKRRGKEANKIERRAMNDAFLQDALDGFDAVNDAHSTIIENLEKRISETKSSNKIVPVWRWIAAVVAFLLVGSSLLYVLNTNEKNFPQTAKINVQKKKINTLHPKDTMIIAHNTEIKNRTINTTQDNQNTVRNNEIEISESLPVNTKKQNMEISEDNYNKRDDAFAPENSNYGYHPQSNSASYNSKEIAKIAGLRTEEMENAMWLKEDSINIDPKPLGNSSTIETKNNQEIALQGKIAGMNTRTSSKKEKNILVKGTKTASAKNPIKVANGRLLDDNGEPLIGAIVKIKDAKKGVITNINGEFSLPISEINQDSLLVASYIGMENKEIPISENVGDIQLLASDKTLNEVTVIGYGVENKGYSRNSATSTNDNSDTFDKYEFTHYFKQNYNKNICSNLKVIIVATFKLNEKGHPTHVTILESNCLAMENELKKWLEKSPDWTRKNKQVTIKIKL